MAATLPSPPAPQDWILAFLKAPHPGTVKSRLATELDAPAAAAIYRSLLTRSLAALRRFPNVVLRHAPDDAGPELESLLRPGWRLRPQGEGDLGARIHRAVTEAFQQGASRLVVIGTDAPGIEARDIHDALLALHDADVVLGPALDGGYWLIGLRKPEPALFENMPWSTADVARLTRERAAAGSLSLRELRTLSDVDTLEDWRRWLRDSPI